MRRAIPLMLRRRSSTAEASLRGAAAADAKQQRSDAARREASRRWREGGRLLDEFRRLERDRASTREETRLAVMVALKRSALQRPAHVAAAARALAARGDAAGAAWLVGGGAAQLLPARATVNNAAYAAAFKACGLAGDADRAQKLLETMRERGVEPDGLVYAGAIRAGVDGLLEAALRREDDPTAVIALRAALRRMSYGEAAALVRGSPLPEEADYVLVARRCAAAGDVELTDAVAERCAASPRVMAARVAARGNAGDVRGALALAEATSHAVVANAAMRCLALAGDGAAAAALLQRLPAVAVDRGTYLLAMRAHKTDADGCLALFRACEPATGEAVDEKLVCAALEALGEAKRCEDAAELARDAKRRGIGLDDRGAAALVRAFRRAGDWRGALDTFEGLRAPGPLASHAAVEACRAGAASERAVEIVEGLAAPAHALLADAAAACDADTAAAAAVWRAAVKAGLFPAATQGEDVVTVDAHAMTAPLALGAVVGALQECGDARAVVVLTGDEYLKPQVQKRLEDLGLVLGATENAGALVVPGGEARRFVANL